jgi:hypothetical protein
MIALCWCALMLATFAFTSRLAWSHKSATCDEPLHFVGAWLQTHYGDFRCNPEDPPLWKYFVAAGTDVHDMHIPQVSPVPVKFAADTLYHEPANNADALISAGRDRMIWFGIALGIVIAWWAWRLAGPVAATVATTAFSLDPNFLAHASLIKNDVPITLLFLAIMAAVWLLGERATLVRWIALSLILGAALSTKFSGFLAIPMLAVALILRSISSDPWRILRWTARTRWRRFAAALAMGFAALIVSYIFLWACYDFRFHPTTDPNIRLQLTSASNLWADRKVIVDHGVPETIPVGVKAKWLADWRPDRFIRSMYWISRHHLMPEAWISGFIYTAATSLLRSTFLLGQTDVRGWWYYFPLAMAFKTPLATLAALAMAMVVLLAWIIRRGWKFIREIAARNYWPLCAALVAPILYMISAMRTHLNIGVRHVFPVYPFLFILLGVVAAGLWRFRPRATGCVLAILLAGLAMETFKAYPDFIPFFNIAAGGSRGGLRLLSDSNIDWGQELPDLADWAAAHPDRQIFLSYFGTPDPQYYGIHYTDIPGSFGLYKADTQPSNPSFGNLKPVYVLSACSLQETYVDPQYRPIYDRFRKQQPIAVLGGCLYIYDHY